MDRTALRTVVLATLRTIAPEVEEGELRDDRPLREQIDLDSMDWLNFIIGLHESLQVDIPEADYRELISLNAVLDYLEARLSGAVSAQALSGGKP
ncbi:phosphopantetheine-binding protein [Crenobacter sp. SG2303]|uniref:Phosphopantetheine-binding protein n=1 Tax=Crenobacter oryzisoli TaxID=3056844 RepID=A0ABT7XQR0_9NEIS|nr:phosphopantetheine-binding protein [Crenobacter sp. SG2303]MDN0076121.1 phosphopantetheine-binding protein [Crenobacter sp. SG2303]